MASAERVVVVGAGPVGALAAIYAAERGFQVDVYELRDDLRNPATTPLNFTRSINLALSVRGITALSDSRRPAVLESILADTLPMRGRMIHGFTKGAFSEEGQDYDVHGRAILAVDRAHLNKRLLDELESMPNVRLCFLHKLVRADFDQRKAWFERAPDREQVEVPFDFLIGADGAHSLTRYQLMRYALVDYQQEYIDTRWCEFQIPPADDGRFGRFAISPHHLHIWPGKKFMFIAIPSTDGSFTCTLFLPGAEFTELEQSPQSLPAFFDQHFPGVTRYITPESLIESFQQNPHLPLISLKCRPYHYSDAVVIVGDAAHAMVPFYGQGMNAGLEDMRILFGFLDRHPRAKALAEYSAFRGPDAVAINDMALQNYIEMRESVVSPVYRLRKSIEEFLSVRVPWLGWQTKYSRVSFGIERYSSVITQSERQGRVLGTALAVMLATPMIGLLVWARRRY